MTRIKLALFSFIILFVLLSCSLVPTVTQSIPPTTDPAILVAQALAQTQQMQTQIAMAAQLTMAASGGGALPPPAALPTYTFQPTYTMQYTNTPSTVTVTVSVNTNCRTGPGDDYPIVGALVVGQVAEVVGRSASSDNWIVKLPGKTTTCWLWGYYAAVTGSTAGLPIIAPPPIPATKTNTLSPYINITIVNNSGDTICWVYISGSDDPSWGNNELPGVISPGGSYTWYSYVPDVYDVMIEDCVPNLLKTWYGVSMFVNTWLYYP